MKEEGERTVRTRRTKEKGESQIFGRWDLEGEGDQECSGKGGFLSFNWDY